MMDVLIERLHQAGVTLVLCHKEKVYVFHQRGIADLYALYTKQPDILCGAEIADKVVGKGAAAVMVAGGVARVHADVMSIPALDLLKNNEVKVSYGCLVPHIWNRMRTDWCPVEKLCHDAGSVSVCLERIHEFIQLNQLKNN